MFKRRLILFLLVSAIFLAYPIDSQAGNLPRKAFIEGVIGHPQQRSLSCESRSAVDLAAFWGVKTTEARFLRKLPRSDNPDKGFVGNPDGPLGNLPPGSYGVHAEPVAELLANLGLNAVAHKEMSWDELRSEIANGRPVIVWVVGQMWSGTPVRYKPSQGKATTVARYEHTMILIGYSPKSVTVIDPASGTRAVYPLNSFLTSWDTLGRMAVTSDKPVAQVKPDETPKPTITRTSGRLTNRPDPFDELPVSTGRTHRLYLPLAARSSN